MPTVRYGSAGLSDGVLQGLVKSIQLFPSNPKPWSFRRLLSTKEVESKASNCRTSRGAPNARPTFTSQRFSAFADRVPRDFAAKVDWQSTYSQHG
jgi:hypothetical protein